MTLLLTFCPREDVTRPEESQLQRAQQKEPVTMDVNARLVQHRPQLKPGRRSYHMEFPQLVTTVSSFIKMHGYSAEAGRRTTVGNTMGVSLADVVQHVKEKIPGLKEKGISRHMHNPPPPCCTSQGRKSASRY